MVQHTFLIMDRLGTLQDARGTLAAITPVTSKEEQIIAI